MPGFDVSAEFGQGAWTRADVGGVQRNVQRSRLDGMALASRRALAGDIVAGNAELKQALEGQANLYGWVTVSPADVDLSSQELRRYAGSRSFLGLRLDPRATGQPVYTEAAVEILNHFRRFGKPALVTCRTEADVTGIEELARQVNTIRFIAGGAGGEAWQACGHLARRLTNILLEPFTAACYTGKLEALVAVLGAHRILFATGYPDQNPGAALGLLHDAKIGDGEKQAILAGNAARLFGLQERQE